MTKEIIDTATYAVRRLSGKISDETARKTVNNAIGGVDMASLQGAHEGDLIKPWMIIDHWLRSPGVLTRLEAKSINRGRYASTPSTYSLIQSATLIVRSLIARLDDVTIENAVRLHARKTDSLPRLIAFVLNDYRANGKQLRVLENDLQAA